MEQNLWQAWSLVFLLPTKLSILLKIILFISLKTTKITSKIKVSRYVTFRSSWSCNIQFHKYARSHQQGFFMISSAHKFDGRRYRKFPFKCLTMCRYPCSDISNWDRHRDTYPCQWCYGSETNLKELLCGSNISCWSRRVCFIDIGGIVDNHCLNFLFIIFKLTCVSLYSRHKINVLWKL